MFKTRGGFLNKNRQNGQGWLPSGWCRILDDDNSRRNISKTRTYLLRILSLHTPSSSINLIAFAIHISSRHHDHRPILISNQHHSICFGFLSFQFAFHFDHLHMFFEENCCNHTFSSIAASIQPNTRKKHLGLHTPPHFTSSHSGSVVKVKKYTIVMVLVTLAWMTHSSGCHNCLVVTT